MKRLLGAAGLLCSMLLLSPAKATQASDIQSFTLDNGMTIIVLEDHSIPNANMYLFWKVGSRNEYPGITGISHFFEHMMFNGAKKYGPKMFDRTMEASGGANNAYTTEDLTVYTDWFPADVLETLFELEADRIQHLDINPDVVESERGVVASERTTGLENSNFRAIWEEVKNAAFRAHTYSWSVIGHESDIQNWTIDDLKTYHKTYYAPNNAVVVIAGDVSLAQVKQLSQKYFAPIPRGPEPRRIHTVEPEQKGERRAYLHKKSVTTPNIMMGWHVPSSSHKDYYALDILSDILFKGNSSRMHKTLVDENQTATEVFGYFPQSLDPNLFYAYAVASQNTTAEILEKTMIAEINRIIKEGVTEKELTKVKNAKSVDFYRRMASINGKANTIGTYEMYFGSFEKLFDAPTYYEQVTLDDIKRVANTYLRKANRTVGVLAGQEDSHENDL